MCISIYKEYNIDVNKLTRDYLKFPLQKITKREYEKIPKEDFIYLYIECNLPRKILIQYLNVSKSYITTLGKLYNIKKSYEQERENAKKTNIEKFGVENVFQLPDIQKRIKQTNLQKLGVEHPLQSPIIKEKMKQTNLERYSVENYSQTKECREKVKQTFLKHYGVENYSYTNEFKNLFKDEEFVNQVNEKRHETKKKNGSFGKSEEEDKIYDILLTKFKNVKRQYKSELYPFPCDFYIPEIDLYIEYQGYFTHGFEPYIGTDEQNELIKEWENKPQKNPQYLKAINTWTIRDPLKRNTAKQNNLNWLEFFSMKEFTQWFETILFW